MLQRLYFYTSLIAKRKCFKLNFKCISTSHFHLYSEDFNHLLKSMGTKFNINQINNILASCEEHVNVSNLVPGCPVKEIYINQLPANIKVEDRWNVGVNQVTFFTV